MSGCTFEEYQKKESWYAELFGWLIVSSLQVGKTPKPEMKRILEEINAIKTKVTMLGCFNKKIAGNSQDKKKHQEAQPCSF